MTSLQIYLRITSDLRGIEPDTPEYDGALEELDDLWWKMSEDEREVAELAKGGRWIGLKGQRYCPLCGDGVEGGGASVRCMACMRDVVPEVIECE